MAQAAEQTLMERLVSLCKRRGFVYPASEIYGGLNGFWDYGPLGVQLKNNLRDAWWKQIVESPPIGPDGRPISVVGLDSSIIQNPKTWVASGHVGGFSDPMVEDKGNGRFRADHLFAASCLRADLGVSEGDQAEVKVTSILNRDAYKYDATIVASSVGEATDSFIDVVAKRLKLVPVEGAVEDLHDTGSGVATVVVENKRQGRRRELWGLWKVDQVRLEKSPESVPSPFTDEVGSLMPPREFNLMFETYVGALKEDESKSYLRPETAQGIFLNYKNVVDTMRVKVPFGIAQIGKSFRNEVTPRNFIFRSREFEQMEIEWFCHKDEAQQWFEFWKDQRIKWWKSLGIREENLRFRQQEEDELAHYAHGGVGCVDIEYKYPFTDPDYGELEGVAHRTDHDLIAHQEASGQKMQYFDEATKEKFIPHVIEPAAGLTRGVLVVLADAYTEEEVNGEQRVVMKFAPHIAPIKAAIFPLVKKDGMPEKATAIYDELRTEFPCFYDEGGAVGRRYRRQDEIGTPFCITVDGDTVSDDTVTVRHRDSMEQERVAVSELKQYLRERVRGT